MDVVNCFRIFFIPHSALDNYIMWDIYKNTLHVVQEIVGYKSDRYIQFTYFLNFILFYFFTNNENEEIMKGEQQAIFGGGCFWCVEAVLQRLNGIVKVEPGYCGGLSKNPSYREVCSGESGHAEVVKVTFEPERISYHDLLIIFMTTHDPTTLNRQGNDKGTQYRSVIYYLDEGQKDVIQSVFDELKDVYPNPIVTEVSSEMPFYPAEDYHHNYFNDNPVVPYCRIVIKPKVDKLRQHYSVYLKSDI